MTISGLPVGGARLSFEYIYTNFAKRELSERKDRQYAIRGLERRLKEQYRSETTYGIVHCCLQSSLLWQRFGNWQGGIADKKIPSWSWMKYSGAICYGTTPGFNMRWNHDIKIVQDKECESIEARLWRIRSFESSGEGIKIAGHVPPLPLFDRSPITIGSFRFDHDGDDFTINDPHLGFIVTATHITNRWTEYNPENDKTNWKSFGEISLEGKKPKKLSYTLVISDSPTDDQEKSTEWRRIGVAVIDHEYLILSESPGIIKVK
jgi:hypothetical protein